ncbi:MAG: hypothetical protein OXB84_02495 [Halobacteriovoraceae bacterium]|nr:hypothetical protein [Halobacteriovoraceae bacterium]
MKNITKIIAEAIKEYVKQDGKSYRQIKWHSGVCHNYVARLANEKIASNKLDPLKIFKVLKLVKNDSFAREIISLNADWKAFIDNWVGGENIDTEKLIENQGIEKIITANTDNLIAFILASNKTGTTRTQLRDVGGRFLVKAAEWLIKQDILQEKDDVVKTVINLDESSFYFSKDNIRDRIIPALVAKYDLDRKTTDRSYIYAQTGNCSKVLLTKYQEKIIELRGWLEKELEKEENKGNEALFSAILMDTFNRD